MKLLLVEDEIGLAESILRYLKQEGYLCEWANNYQAANEKIHLFQYDCILVDINLPGGSGLSLVSSLKQVNTGSGIIIISARNAVDDKVEGLDLGADDYLSKPFHLAELNSRIRSVLRRKKFDGQTEVVFSEILVNTTEQSAYVNKLLLPLTKKEYDLLLFLISNKNRVLTKESIAEHLWGDDTYLADSFDFIYTHVKNLRKKLLDARSKDYIKTIYATGYKFSDQ